MTLFDKPSHKATRPNATISDVAKLAGVSSATVSRVVNGDSKVRGATQDKVKAAIEALGYVPNLAARNLASARRARVGVIYNNPSATYLSALLLGAMDQSASHGAELLMIKCQFGDPESERAAVERVVASSLDGVLLPSPSGEHSLVIELLIQHGLPVVAAGGGRAQFGISCVCVDDRAASAEMTRYLLELGHRRIGFIKGHPSHQSSVERLAGFEEAIAACPGASAVVVQGRYTFDSGLAAAEEILDSPQKLTAIFASNDDMAAATISVAHRRGLVVPADLTVVGYDDVETATNLWPPLTTVRQPVSAIAATAIDILLRDIRAVSQQAPISRVEMILPYELVTRQSAAPPPTLAVAQRANGVLVQGQGGR